MMGSAARITFSTPQKLVAINDEVAKIHQQFHPLISMVLAE